MQIDTGLIVAIAAAVQILVTVGGGFYFMGRISSRLDLQDSKIDMLTADVLSTKSLVISAAVHEQRLGRAEADIQNAETDIRRLRVGSGYINDGNAKTVSREY